MDLAGENDRQKIGRHRTTTVRFNIIPNAIR
jgi:hypothetical protein